MNHRLLTKLSRVAFRHAFHRFQRIHRRDDRRPLVSFRDPRSYVHRTEDYKEEVARNAERLLDSEHWTQRSIGHGDILRRVIAAIEQPGNNLLQWDARFGPRFRVHRRLIEAQTERKARREFEAIFFEMYARGRVIPEHFEHLAWLCGRRYELIAYLFFIADRHHYLPIRTTSFDRAFTELGLPLRTARQCSWPNYQEYLETMTAVQYALNQMRVGEVSLLDAHSFCWVLASYGRASSRRHLPPRLVTRLRQFSGVILTRAEQVASERESREERDVVVDMKAVVERRGLAGEAAEEIAVE